MGGVANAREGNAAVAGILAVESRVEKQDKALGELATVLGDWLAGRAERADTRGKVASIKARLSTPAGLPAATALAVKKAESGMFQAVDHFTAAKAPDGEGQKSLFGLLNGFTRDRALALLGWRAANNKALSTPKLSAAQRSFLLWEAAWLPLWRAEIETTYRLQKSTLSAKDGQNGEAPSFVRELLLVQSKASAVKAPKELASLQELASLRITVLARTAEQLARLGNGKGGGGALARLRRLNREQTDLGERLQAQRLAHLKRVFPQGG